MEWRRANPARESRIWGAVSSNDEAAPQRLLRRRTHDKDQRNQQIGPHDESGVALIEFALVLPLLLLVLCGIFEFGRIYNYWIDETHLANEAARWAAVDRNPGGQSRQRYDL